jgi:hypothetical protein
MSMNTAEEQYCFFSKVPLIISVIRCTCSVVECFCRNPNWWSRRIRFSSSIGRNLLSIAFLNILLIIGSKLISLYELASSSSFPGFGIFVISPKDMRGLINLWLYKENNKLQDWKNVFTYSSWASHTYDFVVLNSLTHPKKILLVVLHVRKAKNLSAPLHNYNYPLSLQ